MSASDWFAALSLTFWLLAPLCVFMGRHWLTAWISKGIQHEFDKKIEELRADLRLREERLRSALRDREAEIAVLRQTVLTGSAGRQAIIDKRRFEAVERIWTAVNDMAQLKLLASMSAIINFDAIAKDAGDPKIREFFRVIEKAAPEANSLKNVARDERPFLPELAWAYFSAYVTVLTASYIRVKLYTTGLENPESLYQSKHVKKVLKAVLPHQSEFIENHGAETYFYLLEEVENNLLAELRKIIDGKEVDQTAAARAKEIMHLVRETETAQAEILAAT